MQPFKNVCKNVLIIEADKGETVFPTDITGLRAYIADKQITPRLYLSRKLWLKRVFPL